MILISLGAYIHQFLNYELKDQQFVGEAIPENRIFAQYHKDYTQAMKQHIISELIREVPKVLIPFFYLHSMLSKYITECIDYILKTEITLPPYFALWWCR
jgi:hypothetical protein